MLKKHSKDKKLKIKRIFSSQAAFYANVNKVFKLHNKPLCDVIPSYVLAKDLSISATQRPHVSLDSWSESICVRVLVCVCVCVREREREREGFCRIVSSFSMSRNKILLPDRSILFKFKTFDNSFQVDSC